MPENKRSRLRLSIKIKFILRIRRRNRVNHDDDLLEKINLIKHTDGWMDEKVLRKLPDCSVLGTKVTPIEFIYSLFSLELGTTEL